MMMMFTCTACARTRARNVAGSSRSQHGATAHRSFFFNNDFRLIYAALRHGRRLRGTLEDEPGMGYDVDGPFGLIWRTHAAA